MSSRPAWAISETVEGDRRGEGGKKKKKEEEEEEKEEAGRKEMLHEHSRSLRGRGFCTQDLTFSAFGNLKSVCNFSTQEP